MASSLRPFIRKEEGLIKIFANYGAAVDFLPYDLAEYMTIHNEISFVLEQRPSIDVVRAVSTGEADIGISVCEVIPESLRSFPYHEDRLVAIVPEKHPFADRARVDFKNYWFSILSAYLKIVPCSFSCVKKLWIWVCQ